MRSTSNALFQDAPSSSSELSSVGVKRRKDLKPGIQDTEIGCLKSYLLSFMVDAECLLDVDLSKDRETIQHRIESEGFGFVSKTLPEFLQWFRRCIEDSLFTPCPIFKTYRTLERVYPYPAFLRGLVRFFSTDDGEIIIAETPAQLEYQREIFIVISMICQTFGAKYEVPLPEDKLDKQIRDTFKFDAEEVFVSSDVPNLSTEVQNVMLRARRLLKKVFEPYIEQGLGNGTECLEWKPIKHVFDITSVIPRHGSGATACPSKPHEKYTRFINLPSRYSTIGTYSDLFNLPSRNDLQIPLYIPQSKGEYNAMQDYLLGGVGRMCVVPKNSKKGRPINLEQTEYQFGQQGVRVLFYDWLERNPITGGYINFTNQEINGKLAIQASEDGGNCTIDITRASDSVTRTHTSLLFEEWMSDELNALRSRFSRATVGIYKKGKWCGEEMLFQENEKYAPMGSALCFPVEALIFWAVCKSAIEENGGSDSRVWVYGDDLIFPSEHVGFVTGVLAELKIKVNQNKSYYKGLFRESCGMDAFNGQDVSPHVRISTRLPISSLEHTESSRAASIVAWVEYANTFERSGFPGPARAIRNDLWLMFPSTRSYPQFDSDIPRGYLYWLNYGKQPYPKRQAEGNVVDLILPMSRDYYYNYSPVFPAHPCKPQGELFTTVQPNILFGSKQRLWNAEIKPYRTDLDDNLRLLRYWCEGVSEVPGNWFTDKDDFRLTRKSMILT